MGQWRKRTAGELVAYRADLMRVARECGLPEGVAPSRPQYAKLGRWSETRLRGVWGFKNVGRDRNGRMRQSPALGWVATVKRFGLRPNPYRTKTREEVMDDVHRVFGILGRSPSAKEYRSLGRYAHKTVQAKLGVESWPEVRAYLDGKDNWRRDGARQVQRSGVESLRAIHKNVSFNAEAA